MLIFLRNKTGDIDYCRHILNSDACKLQLWKHGFKVYSVRFAYIPRSG